MKLIYSTLAALSLVLSSCGGGDLGPTAASGTVNQAQATTMKTNLDQFMSSISAASLQSPASIVTVNGITTSSIKLNSTDPEAGCTTISPSTLVDADNDGIVAQKDYTYDCSGIVHGNFTYDKMGTVKIRDDDTLSVTEGGGYSFEYDLTYDSGSHYNQWKGTYGLERDGNTLTFSSLFSSIFSEDQNNQYFEGSWQSNFTYIMEVVDVANPYDAGTITESGFYRLIIKGDVGGEHGVVDWDYTFKIVSEGIEYENTQTSGCTYYYKNGYVEFIDESNNSIRYTYTCNSFTYTFNGNVIVSQ